MANPTGQSKPLTNTELALKYLKENQSSAVSILEKTSKLATHILKQYSISYENFSHYASALDGFSEKLCATGASIITVIPDVTIKAYKSISNFRSIDYQPLDALMNVASAGEAYLVAASIFGEQKFYVGANNFSLVSNMSKLAKTAREFSIIEPSSKNQRKAYLDLIRHSTAVAVNVLKLMTTYLKIHVVSAVALIALDLFSKCVGAAATIYGYTIAKPKIA